MKHEVKVTAVIILMFILTQALGLVVIDAYAPKTSFTPTGSNATIPYGMQPPEAPAEISLGSIAISLVIAIFIFFLLMKIKAKSLIKVWFTVVVFLTIAIALNAVMIKLFPESSVRLDTIAVILAVPLTFYKIFRRNMIVHNATELLIYPGLAVIFIPILIDNTYRLAGLWELQNFLTIPLIASFFKIWPIIILLILISIYDIYAVWKSSLMAKLAKFQIQKVGVFTGFLIPYLPKKERILLDKARKIKTKRAQTKALRKIKISLALLGGGDVAFPLIFAGVVYRSSGLVPAIIVMAGTTISLALLLSFSRKGKMYPAMPYLTAGCVIAWLLSLLI